MAAVLTEVMESNSVTELSDVRPMPTNQNDTVMTLPESQVHIVLASIFLPPPPPLQLLPDHQLIPQPTLLPQTTTPTNVLLPLTEEHITQGSHEPPDVLNHTQQLVYRISSEYLTYKSRRRHNLLRAFEHSVAAPLLLIQDSWSNMCRKEDIHLVLPQMHVHIQGQRLQFFKEDSLSCH